MSSFIHLRVHSEYSLVDGLLTVDALVSEAKKQGSPMVALTDEVNLFGAIKFYKAALAAGVKPILGADLWISKTTEPATPHRLTVLCQNNRGYQNLMLLISEAYLKGARYQGVPVIPDNCLTPRALEGLIGLSGGLEGDVGKALKNNQLSDARAFLAHWKSVFPEQRFYIEIRRTQRPFEEAYIQAVLPLAAEYELPLVATQDVRFISASDFTAHEIRVAIHEGYTMDDARRPKRYHASQYLSTPEEMQARFSDLPEALLNTVELGKRCTVLLTLDQPKFPAFPVPPGMSEADYLKQQAEAGLAQRLTQDEISEAQKPTYQERLQRELEVIISMGFSGYFLIVSDFIQWSKRANIPVGPGRGSGAGSLVAYALGITGIDPLPYDLLFERFLNPERVSMPDFDIDFCMDGRDRVIDYVAERYGRNSVSQIATFGTMAAKAVVRDVGRVLALPYGFVDSIAKLIPLDLGMTLSQALQDEPQLKARYEQEEDVQSVIDMGLRLEGTVRNVGKHAGGVVISPSLLTDFCPVVLRFVMPDLGMLKASLY